MGGHAFHWLSCPRLSSALYLSLREHFIGVLSQQFRHVAIPPQAPEKLDHGDLDVLVCGPLGELATEHRLEQMRDAVKTHLNAAASRYKNRVLFLAVPIPDKFMDEVLDSATTGGRPKGSGGNDGSRRDSGVGQSPSEGHGTVAVVASHESTASANSTSPPSQFVQIDVQLCDAPSQLPWSAFWTSYGDLSDILKIGLGQAGFNIRYSGFFIRIPSIEAKAWDQSLVYLSNDITSVLTFLGLCPKQYEVGFDSLNELFSYAMSARYLTRGNFDNLDGGGDGIAGIADMPASFAEKHNSTVSFNAYKRTRAPWVEFVDHWLPDHPNAGTKPLPPREEIIKHALKHFDAAGRYYDQLRTYHLAEEEKQFWLDIRAAIPSYFPPDEVVGDNRKQNIISALHRWVAFSVEFGAGKKPIIMKEPQLDGEKYVSWMRESDGGGFTKQELMEWVERNWKTVYELERGRTRKGRHEKVARKLEEKAIKEMMEIIVDEA